MKTEPELLQLKKQMQSMETNTEMAQILTLVNKENIQIAKVKYFKE